jgi:hypothetical protein
MKPKGNVPGQDTRQASGKASEIANNFLSLTDKSQHY